MYFYASNMKPRQFRDEGFKVGQYLKLYKRIQRQLDQRAEAGHNIRTNIGNKIIEVTPNWENDNIEPGTATGAIVSAIAIITDDLIPIDVLADTEISQVDTVEDGAVYEVNVDAPLKQQARFEAMMEAGTGATSLLVDEFEVEEPDVVKKRPSRDTYQFTVKVKEGTEEPKDVGLGILDLTKPPKENR